MRKFIFAILLTLGVLGVNAQGFRSYVDFFGGLGLSKGVYGGQVSHTEIKNIRTVAAFGLNLTEGYMINKMLFAGVGVGGYAYVTRYYKEYESNYGYGNSFIPSILLPVYADFRYIYDKGQKVKPFADLKCGYQFNVRMEECTVNSSDEGYIYLKAAAGFYFQPSIGVRFGGESSGFNLGLTYLPTIHQKLYKGSDSQNLSLVKSITNGSLMLSFGADF